MSNSALPVDALPLTTRSRNLVRFCRHLPIDTMDASFAGDFSFRDSGSRFSILKSHKTAPGPDECFGLWACDDRTLCNKLLGMEVEYAGLAQEKQAKITHYNAMNYYRSHMVEHFCHNGLEPMPPTEGECVIWYAAVDVLCVRYRIFNKSATDVPVRLSWFTQGESGQSFSAAPTAQGFSFENTQTVISFPYRSRTELLAQDTDIRFQATEATFRSEPVARSIPAKGMLECCFAFRFAFNDELFPEWPRDLWQADVSLSRAIAETEAGFAQLPELAPSFQQHLDLTLKAAGTLRSLRYCDFDAQRKRRMTIHVSKSGTAATWFWDTGATLPGLGLMREREAAAGAMRILTGGIKADGTPPVTYERQEYIHGYQMPLLTWGVGHFLALCPDAELMAEVYAPLARYVRHWLERFSTPRGLVFYPPGEVCLDDSLRWHTGSPLDSRSNKPWHQQDWGRSRSHQFVSPDVNAFLYLELRTLAEMATALGKPAEAKPWLAEAQRLAEAINSWLIEPETKTYQDRHIETGAFTGMLTTASFIPIYAGIAPPAVAEVLCRDYLLSPEHFLTTLPFACVDRAHPTFRAGGFLHEPPGFPGSLVQESYWRGRTWIHTNSWLLGALWQSGFHQEADAIAHRILDAVHRSEGISECYDSLTGFANGHPEFMWSSAAVLMMAHRHYTRPAVAQLCSALQR